MTRRGLLKGGLALAVAWAVMARPWSGLLGVDIAFEPAEGLAPLRRLAGGGDISGGVGSAADAVMIGLDPPDPIDPGLEARLRADLTGALWGDWDGSGLVPVTYFTDIRCPVCRVLEPRLEALEGIRVVTREYPLFGAPSVQAARGILAAARQGQGEALRRRLHRSALVPDADTLVLIARGLDLDVAQFQADLSGEAVADRLAEDRALARILRLPGTPSLVVGRTIVVGLQAEATLQDLVAEERS